MNAPLILAVIGTRPEVIKMAPVVAALRRRGLAVQVVATSQHRDWSMMGAYLAGAGLQVDHWLPPSGGDALGGLTEILMGLGEVLRRLRPALVLAVGDTTTVLAAALAARKLGAAFGHVEAGLRAFTRELPEEENRICADALAELLFAPTPAAVANLRRERVGGRVLLTGNTILDATRPLPPVPARARRGVLATFHRQETVDDLRQLRALLSGLAALSERLAVELPLHPRTQARAAAGGLRFPPGLRLSGPLPRAAFLARMRRAWLVLTDSGGVQEEAAILGTPCVTVRRCTERPETLRAGVSVLAGPGPDELLPAVRGVLAAWSRHARPAPQLYGDGRAGERIAAACADWLAGRAARDGAPAAKEGMA